MTEIVVDITTKFQERALLVTQYAVDEEMKKTRHHDMLRLDIREFVSNSLCLTLEIMISKAREWEINLDHIEKRKAKQVQTTGGSAKKPKLFYFRTRG